VARRKLSAFAEKILHQLAAFGFEDAGCDLDAVIEFFAGAKLKMRLDRAETQIVGAEDEPSDTCIYQCSGAHCTGFDGCVNGRADKSVVADGFCGQPQSYDLGVAGRVAVDDRAVRRGGELAAVGIDDDRSDRHFADSGGGSGLLDRAVHPMFVLKHRELILTSNENGAKGGNFLHPNCGSGNPII